jgi:hypothetical protein
MFKEARKIFACSKLVKNEDGDCCFLAFKMAETLLESLSGKKKVVELYKKNTAPKSKIYQKDFQYLKKGQFGCFSPLHMSKAWLMCP